MIIALPRDIRVILVKVNEPYYRALLSKRALLPAKEPY
jgi:hypothetical protein